MGKILYKNTGFMISLHSYLLFYFIDPGQNSEVWRIFYLLYFYYILHIFLTLIEIIHFLKVHSMICGNIAKTKIAVLRIWDADFYICAIYIFTQYMARNTGTV